MKIKRILKKAIYEGGTISEKDVPDVVVSYLESGGVDVSEISSEFGQAMQAVEVVNRFNSRLLYDVAYIFKDKGSGRYGVYATEVTRAIKLRAIRKVLEGQGYKVYIGDFGNIQAIDEQGKKQPDDIKNDIEMAKQRLSQKKGVAIGITSDAILSAAKQHFDIISNQYKQRSLSKGEPIKVDANPYEHWIKIYHLAKTIAHEAQHAQEHTEQSTPAGEAGPERIEQDFDKQVLPWINEQCKSMLSLEDPEDYIEIKPMEQQAVASHGGSMRKESQNINYKPSSFFSPQGSDLSGRFPLTPGAVGMQPSWGLMNSQDQSIPLENRLDRRSMSPLPEGLSQENDSYELQLRKFTAGDEHPDPKENIEELLSIDHDENIAYMHTEQLLNENRPKPLMIPIDKKSSGSNWLKQAEQDGAFGIIKTASYLGISENMSDAASGWYSNLDLSINDRIWPADDDWQEERDKDLRIKRQPRYNPTYNTIGIYYSLENIRGWPYSAHSTNKDFVHIHPLELMASTEKNEDKTDVDLGEIVEVFTVAKNRIRNEEILSTRFVMTEDFLSIAQEIFEDSGLHVQIFEIEENSSQTNEKIFSVWISSSKVPPENIEKAESYLIHGTCTKEDRLLEKLMGNSAVCTKKEKTIKSIVNEVKSICEEYGIKDVYLVGGYPRDIVMGNSLSDIRDLDFSGAWTNQALKVGGLLAERLGVKDTHLSHSTMTLTFYYKGVKVDFKGTYTPLDIRSRLRERGIKTTPLNMDVFNRDFTMNMMVYNVLNEKIYDISGRARKDIERRTICTYFDPKFVCKENPLVMLRAIKFRIRYGFDIEDKLALAILDNAHLLFDGRYDEEKLELEKNKIEAEGVEEAHKLFTALGMDRFLKEDKLCHCQ